MTALRLALIRCSLCDHQGERGLCTYDDPTVIAGGGQIRCLDWRACPEDVEPRYTLRRVLADNGGDSLGEIADGGGRTGASAADNGGDSLGDNSYEIDERDQQARGDSAPTHPLAVRLSLRRGRWHATLLDVPGARPRRAEPLPTRRYCWRDGLLMAAAVVLATWAVTALAEGVR